MKPRYIAHTGKKQPVDDDVCVEVLFKTGCLNNRNNAGWWAGGSENWWIHSATRDPDSHIIAYRVIEQE
jgi:hypothetical protein